MALPQSKTLELVKLCGRKRVLDVPVEKSEKRSKEEKENSSTSSAELENMRKRPRKAVPKKWDHKELPICLAEKLQEPFQSSSHMQGMFFSRNFVQRKALKAEPKMKSCRHQFRRVKLTCKKITENANENELFSLTFANIQSWASPEETKIENCNYSRLESFVLFVDKKGAVETLRLGASMVPLDTEKTTDVIRMKIAKLNALYLQRKDVSDDKEEEDETRKKEKYWALELDSLTDKIVSYPPEKKDQLRAVYLAVVATRMKPKVRKQKTRRAGAIFPELEQEVKFGCRLILDMHRDIGDMAWCTQEIILGSGEDFGDDQLFSDGTNWMSSWKMLRRITDLSKPLHNTDYRRVILSIYPAD